jgi:hypothetical protein
MCYLKILIRNIRTRNHYENIINVDFKDQDSVIKSALFIKLLIYLLVLFGSKGCSPYLIEDLLEELKIEK